MKWFFSFIKWIAYNQTFYLTSLDHLLKIFVKVGMKTVIVFSIISLRFNFKYSNRFSPLNLFICNCNSNKLSSNIKWEQSSMLVNSFNLFHIFNHLIVSNIICHLILMKFVFGIVLLILVYGRQIKHIRNGRTDNYDDASYSNMN